MKILLFISLFMGLFVEAFPAESMVGGKDAHKMEEMSCCRTNKEAVSTSESSTCVVMSQHHQPVNEGCCQGNDCTSSSCVCPGFISSVVLAKQRMGSFFIPENQIQDPFPSIPSRICEGFSSIWRPPKIS